MKKTIVLMILAAMLAALAVSCGSEGKPADSSDVETTAPISSSYLPAEVTDPVDLSGLTEEQRDRFRIGSEYDYVDNLLLYNKDDIVPGCTIHFNPLSDDEIAEIVDKETETYYAAIEDFTGEIEELEKSAASSEEVSEKYDELNSMIEAANKKRRSVINRFKRNIYGTRSKDFEEKYDIPEEMIFADDEGSEMLLLMNVRAQDIVEFALDDSVNFITMPPYNESDHS